MSEEIKEELTVKNAPELFDVVVNSKMPFLNILNKQRKGETAKLTSMGEIQEEFGEMPRLIRIVERDGEKRMEIDYAKLVRIFWIFAKEEQPDLTLDQVKGSLSLEDADEILTLINKRLTIRIPRPLQEAINEETAEPEKSDKLKNELKNAGT